MQFDVIFTPEALALYWQGFIGTLEILVACLLIGGVVGFWREFGSLGVFLDVLSG